MTSPHAFGLAALKAREDTLRISELYATIQGESTRAGRPCVIVRLAWCGLRCRWCDTPYAFEGGEDLAVADVLGRCLALPVRLVSLTGGEPLEQAGVFLLARALCDAGREVIVFTGGHVDTSPLDPRAVRILDVKCPGSGMSARVRWENLDLLRPADEVKFVLADRGDYEWARKVILERALDRRAGAVHLSPAHGTLDPARVAEWMLADGLPARLNVQLHRYVWPGRERGV